MGVSYGILWPAVTDARQRAAQEMQTTGDPFDRSRADERTRPTSMRPAISSHRGKPRTWTLLALILYVVQIAAVGPVHQIQVSAETASGTALSSLPSFLLDASPAAAADAGVSNPDAERERPTRDAGRPPCSNPNHKHRPLPPHNEAFCPICVAARHGLPTTVIALEVGEAPSGVVEALRCILSISASPPTAFSRAPPFPSI